MNEQNIPEKYESLWIKALPLLKQGRPGDDKHAEEVVKFILDYNGKLVLDKDILIPVAIMHDIGHSTILPEHFKYVTGPEKLVNGKLAHMLTGAKIAKELLESINYDSERSKEIVEIISIHDADQLDKVDLEKFYNSDNKKIFHDIDSLDRYTELRIKSMVKMYKSKAELLALLRGALNSIFLQEFRDVAETKLKVLESAE